MSSNTSNSTSPLNPNASKPITLNNTLTAINNLEAKITEIVNSGALFTDISENKEISNHVRNLSAALEHEVRNITFFQERLEKANKALFHLPKTADLESLKENIANLKIILIKGEQIFSRLKEESPHCITDLKQAVLNFETQKILELPRLVFEKIQPLQNLYKEVEIIIKTAIQMVLNVAPEEVLIGIFQPFFKQAKDRSLPILKEKQAGYETILSTIGMLSKGLSELKSNYLEDRTIEPNLAIFNRITKSIVDQNALINREIEEESFLLGGIMNGLIEIHKNELKKEELDICDFLNTEISSLEHLRSAINIRYLEPANDLIKILELEKIYSDTEKNLSSSVATNISILQKEFTELQKKLEGRRSKRIAGATLYVELIEQPLSSIAIANAVGKPLSPQELLQDHLFRGVIEINGTQIQVRRGGLDSTNKAIGCGSFGCILYVIGKKEVIKVSKIHENYSILDAQTEAFIADKLRGSNYVLGSISSATTNDCGVILMERAKYSNLRELFLKTDIFDLKKRLEYALQAVKGLKEIHDKGIIYRDLKFENMLIDETGTLKLIDFGLSGFLHEETLKTWGSKNYMAWEIFRTSNLKTGIPEAIDIYAWGIFFTEIVTKLSHTQSSGSQVSEIITNALKTDSFDVMFDRYASPICKNPDTTKTLLEIAKSCLQKDPWERPTTDLLISQLESFLK